MFTFQAIHNRQRHHILLWDDVKELISMFTFQAIHNNMAQAKKLGKMSKS